MERLLHDGDDISTLALPRKRAESRSGRACDGRIVRSHHPRRHRRDAEWHRAGGYRHPRRPHRRHRRRRRQRRRRDRCPRPARPAGRHRHPGAFPRARPRAQGGSRDRHRRGGPRRRDGRVRDAQHQAQHAARPRIWPTSWRRAKGRAWCDIAFFVGAAGRECGTAGRAGAAAGLRRREDVHGQLDRQPAGGRRGEHQARARARPPAHGRPFRGRGAPARTPCAGEGRRRCRHASGLARRRDGRAVDGATAPAGARGRTAGPCAACHDGGGDADPRRQQGHRHGRDHAAASDAGRARLLSAARHLGADEPADPRGAPSRGAVARHASRASSTASAPTTRRTRARRRRSPIRSRPRACRACRRCCRCCSTI